MHSRKGLFWRSLVFTLLALAPMCAAVLLFAGQRDRRAQLQLSEAAGRGTVGVEAGAQTTCRLLLAVQGDEPEFLLLRIDAPARTLTLCALPGQTLVDAPEGQTTLGDCYLAAVAQGLQGQIPLWVGGGIGMTGNAAADAFKMICLGANGVIVGKILIQLLGCIGNEQGRCNKCNTDKCPTGICTQDPRLMRRLDVDRGAQAVVDYVLAFDAELRKLMAPVGNSSLPVGRSDALVATDRAVADKLGIAYAC